MSDELIKKLVQDANRSAKELLKVDEPCPHGEESWYCTKCQDEHVAVLTAKVAEQAAAIELASVTIAGQVAQLNSANEELGQQDETIYTQAATIKRMHAKVAELEAKMQTDGRVCVGLRDELGKRTHQFANFHRRLCERFGYSHDPVDWFRDQASLEEHIAATIERLTQERDVLLEVRAVCPVSYEALQQQVHDLRKAAIRQIAEQALDAKATIVGALDPEEAKLLDYVHPFGDSGMTIRELEENLGIRDRAERGSVRLKEETI